MKLLLLDANVLVAPSWPNHPFHHRAVARLTRRERRRWATCLLTQTAFVRLSSNPAVIPGAKSPAEAGEMLGRLINDPDHVFLEAKVNSSHACNNYLPDVTDIIKSTTPS